MQPRSSHGPPLALRLRTNEIQDTPFMIISHWMESDPSTRMIVWWLTDAALAQLQI